MTTPDQNLAESAIATEDIRALIAAGDIEALFEKLQPLAAAVAKKLSVKNEFLFPDADPSGHWEQQRPEKGSKKPDGKNVYAADELRSTAYLKLYQVAESLISGKYKPSEVTAGYFYTAIYRALIDHLEASKQHNARQSHPTFVDDEGIKRSVTERVPNDDAWPCATRVTDTRHRVEERKAARDDYNYLLEKFRGMQTPQAKRFVRILELQRDNHTQKDIAEKLGVTERTIRNDLKKIRELAEMPDEEQMNIDNNDQTNQQIVELLKKGHSVDEVAVLLDYDRSIVESRIQRMRERAKRNLDLILPVKPA